jgi:hypothetical protein
MHTVNMNGNYLHQWCAKLYNYLFVVLYSLAVHPETYNGKYMHKTFTIIVLLVVKLVPLYS